MELQQVYREAPASSSGETPLYGTLDSGLDSRGSTLRFGPLPRAGTDSQSSTLRLLEHERPGGGAPAAPASPPASPLIPPPPGPLESAAAAAAWALAQRQQQQLLYRDGKELVATGPNQRNWRGILIALLVIVAVLGLIVFSIVLLSPPDEGPRVKGTKFTLDDVLSPRFRPPPFNGTWVSETELVFRDQFGGVSLLNAENLTTRVIMTNSTFRQLNAADFLISSDLKYVLLVYNKKKVWRYSYQASYHVYEVETQNKYSVSPVELDRQAPRLQHAVWSPRGSSLAFVHDNDVYYSADPRRRAPVRVSSSGVPNTVFNGVADWLYEEEILKSSGAMWFSPDGRYLLYATFNDTRVGELRYPWYGTAQKDRPQYPQLRTLRYPKVGTPNPVVTLWVADVSNPKQVIVTDLKPPLEVKSSQAQWDQYFTSVRWLSNDEVSVVWLNRRQNVSVISICRAKVWNCEQTHLEQSSTWLEPGEAPLFSPDGSTYVTVLPVQEADLGSYPHVVQVETDTQRATTLTQGAFEVTSIAAWDHENHLVYFVAAPEGVPGERHLYRVGDANSTLKSWECLTCPPPEVPPGHPDTVKPWYHELNPCNSAKSSGRQNKTPPMRKHKQKCNETSDLDWVCLFVQPHFSPGLSPRYYVLECLGPDPPFHVLVDALSNTRIAMLDSLNSLRDRLAKMAMPQVRTFKVQVADGFHAHVRFHLPPGLREYEDMIFPLVLHVCGAPGSQLVSSKWGVDWPTYLAGNRNFIVAQVDGRGSGFQGNRMRQQLYRQLGSVEIEDQIAVIKYLKDNLKFIDKERVGVWGWSYGGFAAAMILTEDEKVFRCGISVAPVTSWAHYDSAYSERYMGLPEGEDNYLGYEKADVTKRAGNLQDKMFLLIHGTADHTVHYQQSMLLVRALTKEGVLFRHQTYPDEGNTFSGVKNHLYRVMESFFNDCFGPLDFEEWEFGTNLFSFKQ
ncbi:inactive dipeptidyl peptidase 10-like isoform X2 [Schistocerca gregaria]|uniref:inactive dipeptidyl peptidase 10-like isoform X2 n=1 Tax=Schistocerca gregaria TaxID=7010 RepID=UPI00211DFD62|nr:inactive dipeptidyl peptidase 10-like isoform X2 [Schistocerca gregaria]